MIASKAFVGFATEQESTKTVFAMMLMTVWAHTMNAGSAIFRIGNFQKKNNPPDGIQYCTRGA